MLSESAVLFFEKLLRRTFFEHHDQRTSLKINFQTWPHCTNLGTSDFSCTFVLFELVSLFVNCKVLSFIILPYLELSLSHVPHPADTHIEQPQILIWRDSGPPGKSAWMKFLRNTSSLLNSKSVLN